MPWGKVKDPKSGEWRDMSDDEKRDRYGQVERPPSKKKGARIAAEPEEESASMSLEELGPEVVTLIAFAPLQLGDKACQWVTGDVFKMKPRLSYAQYISETEQHLVLDRGVAYLRTLKFKTSPLGAWLGVSFALSVGALFTALAMRGQNAQKSAEPEGNVDAVGSAPPVDLGRSATVDESKLESNGTRAAARAEPASSHPAPEVLPEPDFSGGGSEGLRENVAIERVAEAPRAEGFGA